MEITIGKSLKKKGPEEAKKALEKRYLSPDGPYAKLVAEKKAPKVTQNHIDSCISKNFKVKEVSKKEDRNADAKTGKQSDKASEKKS